MAHCLKFRHSNKNSLKQIQKLSRTTTFVEITQTTYEDLKLFEKDKFYNLKTGFLTLVFIRKLLSKLYYKS